MGTFTRSQRIKRYRCRDLRREMGQIDAVDDRQKRVPWFSQCAMDKLTVSVIGAGGLGSAFVRGAVAKGVRWLNIYDGDIVTPSNLNRQFFTARDIGKNKAHRLARNASRAGFMGTQITAVPFFFQAALDRGIDVGCDLVFCGVDNDETRKEVGRIFFSKPVVFAAVSSDAGHGYVAVQEPGKACFGCFWPPALPPHAAVIRTDGTCPVEPAVVDVLWVVAGLALYAVDSLVMDRPRTWNFRQVTLSGLVPEINAVIAPRPGCPLCGGRPFSALYGADDDCEAPVEA